MKFKPLFLCVFLIVTLVLTSGVPIPVVKAQEPSESEFPVLGNPSLPDWKNVTVTVAADGKSFTVDNADNLTWTFQYGTNKYDSIYQNDNQIVKDELWMLQYYDGSWKDIGSSLDVLYEQIQPYNVRVTQSYTSANGHYNVTWDFYGGFRPKITVSLNILVAGNYRVDWRTYVYKDYAENITNYVKFWNENETAIVFDYSDVYETFGNITLLEGVEGWIKGKRFDLIFNVGALNVGLFTLDPTFGYETKGSAAITVEDYIRGSKFWVFGEGELNNITVYLYVTTKAHDVKCAIYNSTFNLLGETETLPVPLETNSWVTFSFASVVWLPQNAYYWLLVWADGTAGDVVAYYDGGGVGLYKSASFGDWQTPLTGYTLTSNKFSIYGTYDSFSSSNFGYETEETGGSSIDDTIRGSDFTCPEAGTGVSISAYIKWYYQGTKIKFALYKTDASLVTNGVTEELTKATANGYVTRWVTANFLVAPTLENIDYYIVAWSDRLCEMKYKWSSGAGAMDAETYNGFPNPWAQDNQDNLHCIYCTYTVEGGEAYTADLSQSLSTVWTVLRQWSATVPLTQSLTSTWQTALEWNAITDLSQSFTTSWLVDIIHTTGAIAHIVDLTQTLSTTWNALTSWNAMVDLSQAFATSWIVLVQADFLTSLTQAFSTSWLVDVIHTIGANQYYVDLSQAIATTWTILTQWNGIIDLTQSFGTTWAVLIQTDFITALTQAFTTSWTVDVYHWIFTGYAYNVDLSLQIITSWVVDAVILPIETSVATVGFVIVALTIALCALVFALKKRKGKYEEEW